MKVVVSEFLTLDGVMQAPGGKDEDTSRGFQHGGWQLDNNYIDDVAGQAIMTSFDNAEGLGRRTYEIFAAYWPSSNEEPIAGIMNKLMKYVAPTCSPKPQVMRLMWNLLSRSSPRGRDHLSHSLRQLAGVVYSTEGRGRGMQGILTGCSPIGQERFG